MKRFGGGLKKKFNPEDSRNYSGFGATPGVDTSSSEEEMTASESAV